MRLRGPLKICFRGPVRPFFGVKVSNFLHLLLLFRVVVADEGRNAEGSEAAKVVAEPNLETMWSFTGVVGCVADKTVYGANLTTKASN